MPIAEAAEADSRRALVVRAGALGDLLLLRGVFASLKRDGYSISLLAPARPAQALLGSQDGDVDEILDWEAPEVAALLAGEAPSHTSLATRLSSFACAVLYSRQTSLAAALSRRVPRLLLRDPQPPPGRHAAEWYMAVLHELGVTCVPPLTCLPTDSERQQCDDLRSRLSAGFLAIHPGSGSKRKNWPIERFAQLVSEICQGRSWLLVEGPAERQCLAPLFTMPGAVVARCLPLRALGALLSEAGVYVGNDSGVTHLAAAWGAPTVALFGPTDPVLYSPLGENVIVVRALETDLRSLSVETVLRAATRARRNARERLICATRAPRDCGSDGTG